MLESEILGLFNKIFLNARIEDFIFIPIFINARVKSIEVS